MDRAHIKHKGNQLGKGRQSPYEAQTTSIELENVTTNGESKYKVPPNFTEEETNGANSSGEGGCEEEPFVKNHHTKLST